MWKFGPIKWHGCGSLDPQSSIMDVEVWTHKVAWMCGERHHEKLSKVLAGVRGLFVCSLKFARCALLIMHTVSTTYGSVTYH